MSIMYCYDHDRHVDTDEYTDCPECEEVQEEVAEHDDGWSLAGLWNTGMEKPDERVYEPRDYMYASELGKLETDVFLKMKGVAPSNPPNARSLRKFEAGNLWEWIVRGILIKAGVLISTQDRVRVEYPDCIAVSGKLDFLAGGKIDLEAARKAIADMYLPEKTKDAMEGIVATLAAKYPDGLRKKVLEIKSVSSHMMNALEISKKPLTIHALQAYHYTKGEHTDRADVVYICRDDCRMMEFPIFAGNEQYEKLYVDYVRKMTEYYRTDTEPPKAEPILFDESEGKFVVNRLIGWSPYLTLTYGLADQAEFDDKYKAIPAAWNRVLKRVKEGKDMTKNNEEKKAEMIAAGWDFDYCVSKFIINEEPEDGVATD